MITITSIIFSAMTPHETDGPVMKIAVGPSAPPIMPIEASLRQTFPTERAIISTMITIIPKTSLFFTVTCLLHQHIDLRLCKGAVLPCLELA